MILAGLRELARSLGCRADQADDVVRSEPSARASLSRRGLFKAAGAVAAGSLFSIPKVDPSLAYEFRLTSYSLLWFAAPRAIITAVDREAGTFTVST